MAAIELAFQQMSTDRKAHWETVFATKQPEQVSWTQAIPHTSLALIQELALPHSARIIDVGGGDSHLVDHLLDAGFTDITVLDISEKALHRAKARLGERASGVKWIVSDITAFAPTTTYDLWHDRAAFHFLTAEDEKERYVSTIHGAVTGHAIISTFSTAGPLKCSGLPITQYSAESLAARMSPGFELMKCFTEDHTTPFSTTQNFLFCTFRKIKD